MKPQKRGCCEVDCLTCGTMMGGPPELARFDCHGDEDGPRTPVRWPDDDRAEAEGEDARAAEEFQPTEEYPF